MPRDPRPERDTLCAACKQWTHRLTPDGTGIVFCGYWCEARYMRDHPRHTPQYEENKRQS